MVRISIAAIATVAIHLLLGWAWTVLVGVAIGGWSGQTRRSMIIGALGVGLGWAALVAYNFVVAGPSTRIMIETMGELMGNTAGGVVVAATLLIGGVLGALGGLLGGQSARLVDLRPQ